MSIFEKHLEHGDLI